MTPWFITLLQSLTGHSTGIPLALWRLLGGDGEGDGESVLGAHLGYLVVLFTDELGGNGGCGKRPQGFFS